MKSAETLTTPATTPYAGPEWKRARSILARSFYKEMRTSGLTHQQVIELSTELLDLVTGDLRGDARVHTG